MGSAPKTAFKKISYFNELIGNAHGAGALQQQMKMIREEFEELVAGLNEYENIMAIIEKDGATKELAVAAHDAFAEVRDGIADVLVTTYGLGHRAGLDCDADLDAVYKSNMSKFIKGDLKAAQDAGDEIGQRTGLELELQETAPGIWAITSLRDQLGLDGKEYPAGKLLKPSTYENPIFDNEEQVIPKIYTEEEIAERLARMAQPSNEGAGLDASNAKDKPLAPGLDESRHGDLPKLSSQ